MTGAIDVKKTRRALTELPQETWHAETPKPEQVYLPASHLKAMDPDTMLVTGMRGAGKTFWWSALQNPEVRQMIRQPDKRSTLTENTQVRAGFGIRPVPDEYPGQDALRSLMNSGVEPRTIWRTVQAQHVANDDHPLRQRDSWRERATYVDEHPDTIERLFHDIDTRLDQKGFHSLLLFDALDRCSDDWTEMYRLIRGLMQHALDMRSYRRLRVKVFLRSDQVDESRIADFPDASKVLSSAIELNWPRRDLYGLLWHCLVNGSHGDIYRQFLRPGKWDSDTVGGRRLFTVPRPLINDEILQRKRFHVIAGPWMGKDRRRGFPYTWIPNHLGDAGGRVSPRSFLAALRTAAEDTQDRHPEHLHALHYTSINQGVQKASQIRVRELREDYPWVNRVLEPLAGVVVPCKFGSISRRWRSRHVLDHLKYDVSQDDVKLPPRRLDRGASGVREDLELLRVFLRLRDGRVNIPDVFRVGYGLGRKGGVRPVR